MVNNDEVQEVVLKSGTLTVTPKDQKSEGITYQVTMMGDEQELVDLLQEKGITYHKDPPDSTGTIIYTLLTVILPVVMLVAVMVWVMRSMNKGGGVMGVGKSRAKAYVQKETGVTFRDVAGQDEAKESLQEVVDFLHNPGKYTTIGAKLPKGALLVGPPGTGKTLLAKAVAGEAHVPFFSMSASEFVEMFVGVGASRVRDLFEEAKKNAPCIIFIDEIDAIGKSRDNSYNSNDEREQTLNQLLAEMDGFDSSKGILILAATNRPEVLDPALLRPGRFDRRIIVERPDLKGRVEILKVHAKNVSLDETVDLDGIALATSGAVGSDLANMINEAAISCGQERKKSRFPEGSSRGSRGCPRRKREEGPHLKPGRAKDRFLPRGRPRTCYCTAEGFRAGTENHDCAAYDGCARLRHAGAGGGEIPQHEERTRGDDRRVPRWKSGRGDRIRQRDNGSFE